MSDDLPYKAEYAKSGRASCKGCKETISQDSIRIAKMVQSSHFDGKMPLWYHFKCFFQKFKPASHLYIANFDSLRWDDQEKIKMKLPAVSSNGTDDIANTASNDFLIEYSKSSRAKCRKCENTIEKTVIRIAKMEVPEEKKYGIDLIPRWHHLDCFVDIRAELGASDILPHQFPGFNDMNEEDRKELSKKFGVNEEKKKPKKIVKVATRNKKVAQDKDAEMMKEQNKKFWEVRDKLFRTCSNGVIRELLEANGYITSGGEADILDRCADGILFGALELCPECEDGRLKYSSDGYICTGNISAWTGCTFKTLTPKRKCWNIPKELKEDNNFLENLKLKVSERKFSSDAIKKIKEATLKAAISDLPLDNKKVLIVGKLKENRASIKKKIEELGGKLCTTVEKSCFCCISSPGEVLKCGDKMSKVKGFDIPVVAQEYIDAVKNADAESVLTSYAIAPWGGNRIEPSKSKSSLKRKHESTEETASKKTKVLMKGGAVVDPDSKMENTCHLLRASNDIFTAVLGLVDLTKGINSYYKLQLLEHDDKKNNYQLFRAWGRVGTSIGGNKLEKFTSKEEAVLKFKELYLDKTGNPWDKRKDFVKYPSLFYPIDIDYGQEDEKMSNAVEPGSLSKLSNPVQELIKFIFDVQAMEHALIEYEIDLKKMPLGKLSKKQIDAAYSCLHEASQFVADGITGSKVLDVSNRFFTLIPHDLGLQKHPLLDNMEIINQKFTMLQSLQELEIACSILNNFKEDHDPIDVYYSNLNADIQEISYDSEEYKMIKDYIRNTHAATHSNYNLDVVEIFDVGRKGERQRFRPFRDLHNRKLLWHGSRSTNYAGILSQGLRIAPPEAPVTGYMFGKGVYFADMASKSANYCQTSRSNPFGLLLLCDVALGNMYELEEAKYITKLPAGKHSCKGVGKTCPDPSMDKKLSNGVTVPLGTPVLADVKKTSLLYNEYIVYDTAQINIKYMVKVKFNFN